MTRLRIYAPTLRHAAEFAATLNLALRQWEYGGESEWGDTWADVGSLLEDIERNRDNG